MLGIIPVITKRDCLDELYMYVPAVKNSIREKEKVADGSIMRVCGSVICSSVHTEIFALCRRVNSLSVD